MRSGNTGHPPQNIECAAHSSPGQAEYVLGMYALVFVMIIAMATLQIMQYKADSDIAEDALAASCLAALDVDPYRYGTDHTLVINDPAHAREIFENALIQNMDLNADLTPDEDAPYISGAVSIDDFRIYLVDGDTVTEYTVGASNVVTNTGAYGNMKTPSGTVVRSAGAYARISFDTEGFPGLRIRASKDAYAEMIGRSG